MEQNNKSICATCKHLHAIYSYNKGGLCFGCICTANENCWVNIDRLYNNNKFIECEDYEHYDKKLIEDHSDVKIEKYDYEDDEVDCVNCGYFCTKPMIYPSGKCFLTDKDIGLGFRCKLFCRIDKLPAMKTKVTANIKDLKKIAVQYDMLVNGDGEDEEN